jgi:hypothetical protein
MYARIIDIIDTYHMGVGPKAGRVVAVMDRDSLHWWVP